jgi:hypothetical protein
MKGGFQVLQFGNNVLGPIDRELIVDRPLNLAKPFDQDIDFSALFAHARFRPEGACSRCSRSCESGPQRGCTEAVLRCSRFRGEGAGSTDSIPRPPIRSNRPGRPRENASPFHPDSGARFTSSGLMPEAGVILRPQFVAVKQKGAGPKHRAVRSMFSAVRPSFYATEKRQQISDEG